MPPPLGGGRGTVAQPLPVFLVKSAPRCSCWGVSCSPHRAWFMLPRTMLWHRCPLPTAACIGAVESVSWPETLTVPGVEGPVSCSSQALGHSSQCECFPDLATGWLPTPPPQPPRPCCRTIWCNRTIPLLSPSPLLLVFSPVVYLQGHVVLGGTPSAPFSQVSPISPSRTWVQDIEGAEASQLCQSSSVELSRSAGNLPGLGFESWGKAGSGTGPRLLAPKPGRILQGLVSAALEPSELLRRLVL